MRLRVLCLAAAAPLTFAAMPAQAQQMHASADAAAETILGGEYDAAESALLTQLRANPDHPPLLINLAAVYGQTGRADEARALYTRVLDADEIWMELSNGRIVRSHALARAGLDRLDSAQFARR